MRENQTVIGLDVGTGSLGLAIRVNQEIVKSWVYLLNQDFASTSSAAQKRSMIRTREAHRARENWLNHIWKKLGQEPLKKFEISKRGDYRVTFVDSRLKREFPKKGDNTLYNSHLIKVMLLEGRENELQPWQMYKALHSAIQKRGYGEVPWAKDANNNSLKAKDDEKENKEAVDEYTKQIQKISKNTKHHFSAYLYAFNMGLWNESDGILSFQQGSLAKTFGTLSKEGKIIGLTVPRDQKIKELTLLLQAVQRYFPNLNLDYVLWGSIQKPVHQKEVYNKLSDEERRHLERTREGLLAQKLPRFENRSVANCALFPRFHCCRSDETLAKSFHLLSSLHRLTVVEKLTGEVRKLNAHELNQAFQEIRKDPKLKMKWGLTKTQLRAILKNQQLETIDPEQTITSAKTSGRSAFSKPALYYLGQFYLRGESPSDFYKWVMAQPCSSNKNKKVQENLDPLQGLTQSDFKWLEILKNQEWESFYIPDAMNIIDQHADKKALIAKELGELRNPVVKHRVELVLNEVRKAVKYLQDEQGIKDAPHRINIEFVREDFISEKKKKEYDKFSKENEKNYILAKNDLSANNISLGNHLIKKYLLAKRQGWRHLVPQHEDNMDSNTDIGITDLPHMEIAHIVPEAYGGPRSMWNLFLLTSKQNREQSSRTPYEWLAKTSRWHKYLDNVKTCRSLSARTKELLISPEADALCDKHQQLPQTAWIARIVRKFLHLEFGWPMNFEGMDKKIEIFPGSRTAAARRQFGLDELLGEIDTKNRKNKKHHALDAMVICFLNGTYQRKYLKQSQLMQWQDDRVPKECFKKWLEPVFPMWVGIKKPMLEENFYGRVHLQTKNGFENWAVKKCSLSDLAYRTVVMKKVFDIKLLQDLVAGKGSTKLFGDAAQRFIKALEVMLPNWEKSADPEGVWQHWLNSYRDSHTHTRVRRFKKLDGHIRSEDLHEYCILPATPMRGEQVLKPKGSHIGQMVYRKQTPKGPKIMVRPIYVHEKMVDVHQWVKKEGEFLLLLKSKDIIALNQDVHANIPKGCYRLNSLKADGAMVLSTIEGNPIANKLNIANFIAAGLRKVETF